MAHGEPRKVDLRQPEPILTWLWSWQMHFDVPHTLRHCFQEGSLPLPGQASVDCCCVGLLALLAQDAQRCSLSSVGKENCPHALQMCKLYHWHQILFLEVTSILWKSVTKLYVLFTFHSCAIVISWQESREQLLNIVGILSLIHSLPLSFCARFHLLTYQREYEPVSLPCVFCISSSGIFFTSVRTLLEWKISSPNSTALLKPVLNRDVII